MCVRERERYSLSAWSLEVSNFKTTGRRWCVKCGAFEETDGHDRSTRKSHEQERAGFTTVLQPLRRLRNGPRDAIEFHKFSRIPGKPSTKRCERKERTENCLNASRRDTEKARARERGKAICVNDWNFRCNGIARYVHACPRRVKKIFLPRGHGSRRLA